MPNPAAQPTLASATADTRPHLSTWPPEPVHVLASRDDECAREVLMPSLQPAPGRRRQPARRDRAGLPDAGPEVPAHSPSPPLTSPGLTPPGPFAQPREGYGWSVSSPIVSLVAASPLV